ncbi:MAG: serine/threonine protein kinase [Planctomyces sp.]|nr:serine/threonine protein kinase [Planctomyces sp.]
MKQATDPQNPSPSDDTVLLPGDSPASTLHQWPLPKGLPADTATGSFRFGDYELLQEIARGGMGVVYRARQITLNRTVALKMILSGRLASSEDVARFYIEAEAAATLNHPNIVPIYEIGQQDGQHFFTMGFIEGMSLQDQVHSGPMAPRDAAILMIKVVQAIEYAHSNGVIHRDLKPANILLDMNGEPKVTDFGLARKFRESNELTRTGAIMGTPGYMPPEQASGQTGQIGPASDVYSLGAILYCLLTGRPPFQAANPLETLIQVIEREPPYIRILNPEVDRELEAICLKCLEKQVQDRYASAGKLAEDLNRYLQGDEISICSRNPVERLRRTLTRHRDDLELGTWGTLLLIFSPLVLLGELAIWQLGLHESTITHVYLYAGFVRAVQLAAMLAAGWHLRTQLFASRQSVSRVMWSQWMAFIAGCHLILMVKMLSEFLNPHFPKTSLFWCYPFFSILSGILWFNLGSSYWGFCYLFGAAFFLLSILLPFSPDSGPVLFGGLWSLLLVITGRRLRHLQSDQSA